MNNADVDKEKLAKRIAIHEKHSEYEINDWIFEIVKIKDKDSVLDVGCGTGKQLIPISENTNGLVVGVDLSKESLDTISEKIDKPNVKLKHSSMENMYRKLKVFPKFDIIISCFAIYYSVNPEKTLLELKALLKDDGRLFLCGPSINNNKELLDLHSKITPLPKMHKGFFENMAIKFLENNFKEVKTFHFQNPITFPDVDTLTDYWLSYKIGDKNMVEKFKTEAMNVFRKGTFTSKKEVIGVLAFN